MDSPHAIAFVEHHGHALLAAAGSPFVAARLSAGPGVRDPRRPAVRNADAPGWEALAGADAPKSSSSSARWTGQEADPTGATE